MSSIGVRAGGDATQVKPIRLFASTSSFPIQPSSLAQILFNPGLCRDPLRIPAAQAPSSHAFADRDPSGGLRLCLDFSKRKGLTEGCYLPSLGHSSPRSGLAKCCLNTSKITRTRTKTTVVTRGRCEHERGGHTEKVRFQLKIRSDANRKFGGTGLCCVASKDQDDRSRGRCRLSYRCK